MEFSLRVFDLTTAAWKPRGARWNSNEIWDRDIWNQTASSGPRYNISIPDLSSASVGPFNILFRLPTWVVGRFWLWFSTHWFWRLCIETTGGRRFLDKISRGKYPDQIAVNYDPVYQRYDCTTLYTWSFCNLI